MTEWRRGCGAVLCDGGREFDYHLLENVEREYFPVPGLVIL